MLVARAAGGTIERRKSCIAGPVRAPAAEIARAVLVAHGDALQAAAAAGEIPTSSAGRYKSCRRSPVVNEEGEGAVEVPAAVLRGL